MEFLLANMPPDDLERDGTMNDTQAQKRHMGTEDQQRMLNSQPTGLQIISEGKGFTTDSEGMSANLYAYSTELGWVSIPDYFNDDELVWKDRVTGQTFRRTFTKSAEIVK